MAGAKILIVEDNPVNMELATDLLEMAGYTVCQATDAETGIELAHTQAPGLILMDVGLPGMDGLTAATLLRREAATQAIPIVILTAHAMKGDEEKALQVGCAGYITKPIDTRSFPKMVAGFLCAASVAQDTGAQSAGPGAGGGPAP